MDRTCENDSDDGTFIRKYCLFCYKPFMTSCSIGNKSSSNPADNFLKVLQKTNSKLDLSTSLSKEPYSSKLEELINGAVRSVCNDCAIVIENYVSLYSELELIKLKLRWQIVQLHGIMKASRRVSARVKEYEENIYGNENDNSMDMAENEKFLSIINEFRGKIFKTCDRISKIKSPQVQLHRLSHDRNDHHTDKEAVIEEQNDQDSPVLLPEFKSETELSTPSVPLDNGPFYGGAVNINIEKSIQDLKIEDVGESNANEEQIEINSVFDGHPITLKLEETSILHSNEERAQNCGEKDNHDDDDLDHFPEEMHATSPEEDHQETKGASSIHGPSNSKNITLEEKAKLSRRKSSQLARKARKRKVRNPNRTTKNRSRRVKSRISTMPFEKKDESSSSSLQNDVAEDEDDDSDSVARKLPKRAKIIKTPKRVKYTYPCTFKDCKSLLTSQVKLDAHLKRHGNFPCNFCDFTGNPAQKLVHHELTSHSILSVDRDWIQCSRCNQKFTTFTMNTEKNELENVTKAIMDHYMSKHLDKARRLRPSSSSSSSKIQDEDKSKVPKSKIDFKCNLCDFTSNEVKKLVRHEATTHCILSEDKLRIQCTRCTRTFTAFTLNSEKDAVVKVACSVVEHYENKHLGTGVPNIDKCSICGREFIRKRSSLTLKQHMKECHDIEGKDENSLFRCLKCKAPFLTEYQRQMHVWKEHGLRLSCVHCDMTFPNRGKYRKHMEDHNKKGSIQCNIPGCGETFHSKNSLTFHLARHQGNKNLLRCPKTGCNRTFMNERSLNVHLKGVQHSGSERKQKLQCEKCGKEFVGTKGAVKNRLKIHMSTHLHDGPSSWQFSCEMCGKMCQSTYKLEEHMRTHTKAKPFTCEHCGRNFSIQYNLKRHIELVHKVPAILKRKKRSPSPTGSNNDNAKDVNC